ncbi:DUF6268 family outer membrane beta-barrel protein [Marinomonas aquiplantarum]|uniref:OmpA family protein n=1 Tax=Marinomonas aquiplantarum TaxID=491951 RepID=A0A366CWK3_9GAMM|nr:DUF6268 family outer membrane beta-barrel protein [Marinomonas aquiplantarum]RBO79851.1 OmpA family protein [Marinomonas aquiplantarum]
MKKVLLGVLAISGASMAMAADKPFTAEVLVGKTSQKVKNSVDSDDTSLALRVAYQFVPSWSAELAYHDYGTASSRLIDEDDKYTDTFTSSAINVGIKKSFEINDALTVNARLGISLWDTEYTSEYDDKSLSDDTKLSDTSNDLYYSVGFEYLIKEDMFVSANYSVSSMDGAFEVDGTKYKFENDTSTVAIGFGYQF